LSALAQTEVVWKFAEHVERIWDPYRYKVLYGGRGGVKSWTAADYHLIGGYENVWRVLCAREVQKSIKESVHQLLADRIVGLGLQNFYEVLNHEIRGANGTKFSFTGLSSLTADSIKSYESYNRFWGEEANTMSRRSLDILTPTIRSEGSELMFTLNPELDTDEVYSRYIEHPRDDTLAIECSYHNNPWFPKVLDDERLSFLRQVELGKRRQSDYDWIWGGKCKPAIDGAVYPDEVARVLKDGRLMNVPHNPILKTHVVFDLGWNDSMVILFVQVAASAVHIIDCIIDSHRTYASYVQEIKDRGYTNMGKAWLPHDGKAKSAQTGKSPIELLIALGLDTDHKGVPNIGVNQGIEAARQMFPRTYFDKTRCGDMFNQLRRYARVISPTTGEAGSPKHDENSHAADAFRYVAVAERMLTNNQSMKPLQYDDRGVV
jgi:phage terminase large subunit